MSERVVYSGRVVTLRLVELPHPHGTSRVREIVDHADGAAVVAVDERDRVLLVRQYRPAIGQPLLELPAGIVDPGEEPLACALRELEEETGYTAGRLDPLVRFYTSPGFCTEQLHVFLASGLRVCTGQPDEDEELELVPVPVAEAVEQVWRGEITDAKTVVGLLAYWGDGVRNRRSVARRSKPKRSHRPRSAASANQPSAGRADAPRDAPM